MKVTGICIYPIKGTAAISLTEAEVRPRGLAGDRRWVVVDQQGRFLQQRIRPKLALVRTSLDGNGALRVEAPDMPALRVPIPDGKDRLAVTIWRDRVDAALAAPEAAAWFSAFLGETCRLAFMDEAARRPVTSDRGSKGDVVSFADSMPLLITTETSLADLNRRLTRPISMSRFRPNLVVDGDRPWQEDGWRRLRAGAVAFAVTHPCTRCVVTTIDQRTGQKSTDGEPLRTLATFRQGQDGVRFGLNLVPRATGIIRLGDQITAVES